MGLDLGASGYEFGADRWCAELHHFTDVAGLEELGEGSDEADRADHVGVDYVDGSVQEVGLGHVLRGP
ncbi:hypothetical protein EV191_1323 [Tamaricihabitans halophyticus]|uniref:Uncharacterized protein n=1 Tax=Tamaricihabitans halophyticus TaxID=1262583 RepID=A0A4R2PT49_9PSEU|nr:hypothetical protein [Tamaricihabitans halophyticus]TCP39163.1 hypothetical protein EV191_1323 [Tamaricihabitans halophyticus]